MLGTLHGRSAPRRGAQPTLEPLESRNVLSPTATLTGGVLTVIGTADRDNLRITLESTDGTVLATGVPDHAGRVGDLADGLPAGDLRLRFDTGSWFAGQGLSAFYPEVVVVFGVEGEEHFHVPLLLSPFGYSTYRGS